MLLMSNTDCFNIDKADLDSNNIPRVTMYVVLSVVINMLSLSVTAVGCTACDAAAVRAAPVLFCP